MNIKNNIRIVFNALLLLISISMLVYFCIQDNNLITLINSFSSFNYKWLTFAILSMFIVWISDSIITYNIVKVNNRTPYTFSQSFKTTMVGQFFGAISPYNMAAQPMQIVSLINQKLSAGEAMSVTIRKFLVYQITLTLYSLFVIIFKFSFFLKEVHGFMSLSIAGFISQSFIVVILLLFSKSPKFTTKLIHSFLSFISKLHIIKKPKEISQKPETQLNIYIDTNREIDKDKYTMIKLYLFMFIELTVLFSIPFLIYKAFNSPGFPFFNMIAGQAFVNMVSSSTPLPGGSGASECMFLLLFKLFFNNSIIKPAMILCRLISYYSCILIGIFFFKVKKQEETSQNLLAQ